MKNTLIFLVILFVCTGCTDSILDLTNKNQLSEDNFWKTENDAMLGLMGTYNVLQSTWLFDSYPWQAGAMRFDYISDNGYMNWQWTPWSDLARGEFTSTSSGNSQFFSTAYDAINRSNLVIANVPGIGGMDSGVVDRMIAEARVIRSTVYLQLAMTYGDVPLITEPKTIEEASVPKSSKDDIFNFIFQDLAEASEGEKLPVMISESEWGRITKGAALGMLARAYLYNGDWQQSADAAKQVMDLEVNYTLFPNYSELFTEPNEVNDEVIFPVTFERGLGGEGSAFGYYPGSRFADHMRPLPSLANAYYCIDGLPVDQSPLYNPDHESENRDPRFKATLVANGDTWKGNLVEEQPTYYMRKWTEEDHDLDHADSGQDWYILRYAHILLIRAEALAQLGTENEAEVYDLINQIRDRAGMPHVEDVEGTGLSKEELLKVVKHERRVETAFEGLRYFDLKRWGEIGEAYEEYNETAYQDYGPERRPRSWNEKYMKWPLPQSEINANENLKQHSGF